MPDRIVEDCEQFYLVYHEESQIIHHQWHQFIYGDNFRKCLMKGVELMEETGAAKWLSDDRNTGALAQEDFEWSTNIWRPRAFAAGWRYWALVLPEKITGQMSFRKILKTYYGDSPVNYSLFNDPDEGMKWLKAQ